jgi:hypothetical protein
LSSGSFNSDKSIDSIISKLVSFKHLVLPSKGALTFVVNKLNIL